MILDHQIFVYNQAYNTCLNLWLKEQNRNKNLEKKYRKYRKAVFYDRVMKSVVDVNIKIKLIIIDKITLSVVNVKMK